MKISELLKSGVVSRAMQIPVAIAGENRSLTLGQVIDTLSTAIVPFDEISTKNYGYMQIAPSAAPVSLPVVFRTDRFYALNEASNIVSGIITTQAVFYTEFPGSDKFYDDKGNVRTDCLFISKDGRLYRYSGGTLQSAGITTEQAEQIKLLTPIEVESEAALEALEKAGLIVPGQMYYIPEDD